MTGERYSSSQIRRGFFCAEAYVDAIGALALLLCLRADCATWYVWTNSPSNGPGTSWQNAFHTIQAAVDAASPGDTVLVTNGVYEIGTRSTPGYASSNRVVITKAITVRSVNGPGVTVIKG
ncbi:MAG: hypothetical protein N2255_02075, partial [Kiritimatiellae bacterium]|nr:hypothetical protein [Kiritimatiellia bacterium]